MKRLQELQYALDQAAIVAVTDHQGKITQVNDKFCEISGYSREELIGQDHRIINSGYHPRAFIRNLWRTIARGQVWRGELRNRAKDGSYYWVDTTIVPFVDHAGKPRQYLAIRYDITSRKTAESKLLEQAALTQLGQLAAVVAHEVRNPLGGIRGSLQVIESGLARGAQERDIIHSIIKRIDQLGKAMENLLLYARPQPANLGPVHVGAVVAEVTTIAGAPDASRGPAVTLTGQDAVVRADPEMMRAVLLNLLLNASQAAPGQQAEIETLSSDGLCRIRVLDRGPGVPAEVRDRIFEPFVTARSGGTGLGLAIAKRLIEAQDGTISLLDREGGGTIAEIVLPLAKR
jgi:PAS domain S-box-containing protein